MGPSSSEAASSSAEENNDLKSSVAAVPPPQAIYDSTPPVETNASTSTTTGTTTTASKPLTDLVSNPLPPVERDITNKLVTSPPAAADSKKASSTTPNQQNNSGGGGKRTFTATVTDYDPQICDGFLVEAAVACFVLKGEDRYTFVTNASEPLLDKVQSISTTAAATPSSVSFSSGAGSRSPRLRRKQASSGSTGSSQQQPPQSVVSGGGDVVDDGGGARLVAFAGVFDGHDGPKASQYCSRGMLHHILAETNRVSQKVQKEYNKSSGGGSSSTRSFFGGGSVSGGGGGDSISSRGGSINSAHTSTTSFKNRSRTTFFGPKSTNNDDNQQQSSTSSNKNNKDINIQVLKQGHVNGFTWAQTRFGTGANPPTWDELLEQQQGSGGDIQQIRTGTKSAASNFFHRLFFGSTSIRSIRGGTTATTIALYSKSDDSSSSNNMGCTPIKPIKEGEISTSDSPATSSSRIRRRPVLCALVACTGDSRCITDDGGTKNAYGSNLTEYRAVTKDHRPGEPEESRRIQKLVKKGVCLLQKDDNPFGTLRLYPGGLAVSRTVGDVQLTEAAIPTPEVFTVALNFDHSNEKNVTYRFVIASDGLWDVFDTDDVGRIVSQDIFEDDETDQRNNNQEQAAASTADGTTTTTMTTNKGDGDGTDHDETDKNSNAKVKGNSQQQQQRRRRRRTPKQAAKELLDSCIKQGGYEDDVTILVLDVSLAPTDKDTNQSATTSTTGDQ